MNSAEDAPMLNLRTLTKHIGAPATPVDGEYAQELREDRKLLDGLISAGNRFAAAIGGARFEDAPEATARKRSTVAGSVPA